MKKTQAEFIPVWLDELDLSVYEFRLFCHISRRGELYASLQTTADLLKISKRHVQDCLISLTDKGLLEKKCNGQRKPASYICKRDTIAPHATDNKPTVAPHAIAPETIACDAIDSGTVCHSTIAPHATKSTNLKDTPIKVKDSSNELFDDLPISEEKIEVIEAEVIQPLEVEPPPKKAKPPKQVQTFDAEFDEFWENYPKNGRNKGDKKAAHKKLAKILQAKQAEISQIINGVIEYAAYLNHTGQLNADATTWLNNNRWENDWAIPSNCNKQSAPDKPRSYGDTVFDVFDRVRKAHGI